MASYQSNLDQFNTYQAPGDLSLINQTLAIQQEKYDVGEKNYQDNLSQLKVQENLLLRPEDRDRFARNVQGLIDEVNSKEGGIDWAKRGLTNKINSYTKQALDDYTLEQIGISQQIKTFQNEVAEKAKKNDGSYSDTNYAYAQAQAGIGNYLKGVDANGNKVDNIGNLQYHNYIDVTKSALEKVKAFKDLRGDETVEKPIVDANGVMRMEKVSVKGLTESELLAYVPQILSPEESKQLQINGWAKYQGEGALPVAQETFKNYTKDVNENLDKNIAKYAIEANNKNISQEQRDKAHREQLTQEDLKKQYSTAFSSVNPNDAASIGGFLETVNWKVNFAKMAGAKPSISYDTDSAAYAAANLELAKRKEQMEEAKFPYELEKLKREAAALTAQDTGVGAVSLSTVEPEKTDETQPYESLAKDFNRQSAGIVASGQAVLEGGGVDDETKTAYDNKYNDAIRRGYAPATATKIAFSESGMKNLFPEQYANILEAYTRRGASASVLKEADAPLPLVFNKNPEKYIEQARSAIEGYNKLLGYSGGRLQQTPEIQKQKALNDFVNSNGGLQKLSQKLKDPANTSLINQFSKLVPQSSLIEDSRTDRNEVVVKRGQGIVNTAQIATVTNPKVAEQIINAIPQEQDKIPFDPKQGITYKSTPDGNFVITQSGAKEGAKGLYGTARTYTVKPTDDLYKVLNNLTLNEAQRREVTAGNYTTPIHNENIQYLDSTQKSLLTKASTFIGNTLGANFQMASKINPSYFLTQPTTNQAYKQQLRGVISEDKIDALTALMSRDTYNKFTVSATPVQGQWTTSVSLKKGGSPLLLSETETGKRSMDKQLLLLVKQYPQIVIGEALLEYIQQNPKEIDTVLKRLQ